MPRGKDPNSLKNLKPIQPGEVRNPGGRKTAGATIREAMNSMGEMGLTEDQLKRIARSKAEPWPRRAAAERILRTLEAPDIADFAPVLKGEKTIEQLRAAGVNTEAVKKIKPTENGIEIELHDRAGPDFDRVVEHTDGKPKQTTEITQNVVFRTPDDRSAAAVEAAGRIRALLNPSAN